MFPLLWQDPFSKLYGTTVCSDETYLSFQLLHNQSLYFGLCSCKRAEAMFQGKVAALHIQSFA